MNNKILVTLVLLFCVVFTEIFSQFDFKKINYGNTEMYFTDSSGKDGVIPVVIVQEDIFWGRKFSSAKVTFFDPFKNSKPIAEYSVVYNTFKGTLDSSQIYDRSNSETFNFIVVKPFFISYEKELQKNRKLQNTFF